MRAALFSLGLFASLVGCNKSAPPPGKPVSVERVCDEPDKSRVRVTGYLRYRRSLLSFCSTLNGHKTCDLELYASPEPPPEFSIMRPRTGPEPLTAKLSVPVGQDPGEMLDLPKKFADSDVRMHLPNGAVAAEGSRITVDGTLSVIPADPKAVNAPKACFVNVTWATAATSG